MYFHPKDTREAGIARSDIDNFALWFTHFLAFQRGRKAKEYEVKLEKHDKPRLLPPAQELLQALHQRQQARCAALRQQYPFRQVSGTVDWRLIIGLGGAHVLETSMTLHHVYGIPYIPGSAVKGMTRHYFLSEVLAPEVPDEDLDLLDAVMVNIDHAVLKEIQNPNTPETIQQLQDRCKLKKKDGSYRKPDPTTIKKAIDGWDALQQGQTIFGSQGQRGMIHFFDALPEGDVQFQKDIMNPHYPAYYKDNSKTPPNDCQNPIPIPFLTIEEAAFNFPLIAKPLPVKEGEQRPDPESVLNTVQGWLEEALQWLGIGAKTAVGYGYFMIPDALNNQQPGEEAEPTLQAEEPESPPLEDLSPVERLCEELRTLKYLNRSYEIYAKEIPNFEGDEKKQLAQALKDYWISINRWSGKQTSKQLKKVEDIKSILDER